MLLVHRAILSVQIMDKGVLVKMISIEVSVDSAIARFAVVYFI